MNPKHIKEVPDARKAFAPYNFVELPDKVVEAQELPEGDRYHKNRYTGKIVCTLTTESPLYTRCGWTTDDYGEHGDKAFHELLDEMKQKRANFFIHPVAQQPTIPASSLRGMLRALVEIASFSKIEKVSDSQKFFFRAVAAEKDDPLAEPYKKILKKVQAGYLVKQGDTWLIRPAKKVDNLSFVWIKDKTVKESVDDFISLTSDEYYPQYRINISFEDTFPKNGRRFAGKVSTNPNEYEYVGVLVTSGNMAETGEAAQTKRKNHCLVREPDSEAQLLRISDDAVRDYCSSLTVFQKQPPNFNEHEGALARGRCIFYCDPKEAEESVILFGQSPYFRIPYSPACNGEAATARDFIPPHLKDTNDRAAITDIAEAIFGFVRRDKQLEQSQQAHTGRISISDGTLKPNQEEKIQVSLNQEPQKILLSSPKATTFQHYLAQPKAQKKTLKHYASQPSTDTQQGETVIRGHKLYWHKEYEGLSVPENSDTQTSLIKPLDSGIKFTFDIHFENLNSVELGALLWILSLSNVKSEKLETGKISENYCFSLGMGKPLGMGSVKIGYELLLSDRPQRYQNLFSKSSWDKAESIATLDQEQAYVDAFEHFILDSEYSISENDYPEGRTATRLNEVPRIEMLLAMLQCDAPTENVEYMVLEDYKQRKVLPTPIQIRYGSDKDYRRFPQSSTSSDHENQAKKGDRLPSPIKQSIGDTGVGKGSDRSNSKPSQKFRENQVVDAKVSRINGSKVTYEVTDSLKLTEKEPKKAIHLQEGQIVKVRIVSIKDDGSIKSVKCAE